MTAAVASTCPECGDDDAADGLPYCSSCLDALGRAGDVEVLNGDALVIMADMPADSVDAIVTDPPYGLGFMGKEWDGPGGMLGQLATGKEKRAAFAYGGSHSRGYADNDNAQYGEWSKLWAVEALRVLKPGGHLLAFGGTRTWHRLAVAVEDAGFELRDSIAWLYGSGFPKSLDVSKAIDKAAGAERGSSRTTDLMVKGRLSQGSTRGGRSAGHMGNVVERGPSLETAPATPEAEQWSGWGTALKPGHEPIIVARKPLVGTVAANVLQHGTGALNIDGCRIEAVDERKPVTGFANRNLGRWPANVILDEYTAGMLDARFFYCAKAPKSERPVVDGKAHPTVKPLTLIRWLVRLVTPPGGVILDPFAGSGTTVEAALAEGFRVIAIEREPDYLPMITQRIDRAPRPEPPPEPEPEPEEPAMTATYVPILDPRLQQRGGSPDLLWRELAGLITNRIANDPRELQTALGPSEIGDPCARRIGHKLLRSRARTMPPNLKARFGHTMHADLAAMLDADNVHVAPHLDGQERWLVETRVDVAVGISGTVDVYDRITATVVDWKTCGRTMLAKYRREGPGDAYTIQAHLYGLGLTRVGHPVDTVMIIFLPRQGDLAEAYVWHEPFDPDLAEAALQRYHGIVALTGALGDAAVEALPTAPAWCTHCPFYDDPAGSGSCPGHPDARPPLAEPALTFNP